MDQKTRLYQIMHKYGKLTSCDSSKPNVNDQMFVDEILGIQNHNEAPKRIKSHNFRKESSTYIPQGFVLINGYWVLEE